MKSSANPVVQFIKQLIYNGLESFGLYYSSYRGIVNSNEDPKQAGRIQLIIPQIGGDTPYNYWAFPKGVFSGKDYGTHILPQKGDVVWVEFEQGNPEVPIWMHGHFAAKEIPNGDYADPNCYWFKTPKGNEVIINDTKKYIIIQLQDGKVKQIFNADELTLGHDKLIKLGEKAEQPVIKGNDHNTQEKKLLQGIQKLTVNTPMGPSSVPVNIATFATIENELPNLLSNKVKTE